MCVSQAVVRRDHIPDVAEVRIQQQDPLVAGIQHEDEPCVGGGQVGGVVDGRSVISVGCLDLALVVDLTDAVHRVCTVTVADDIATSGNPRHQRIVGQLQSVP